MIDLTTINQELQKQIDSLEKELTSNYTIFIYKFLYQEHDLATSALEDALYYEIQLNEYLRLSGMQEYNRKELVNHLKDDALKLAVKSYEDENK